jgi:hypothetical protein
MFAALVKIVACPCDDVCRKRTKGKYIHFSRNHGAENHRNIFDNPSTLLDKDQV